MSNLGRMFKESRGAPKPEQKQGGGSELRLQNPVSKHFGAFIAGNATKCKKVVQIGSAKGKHLVICGAGPSLAENLHPWIDEADEVWGCNSALIWMVEHGHRVTHGFTVDQTPQLVEEWESAPDVPYLLASSVHPNLVELLEMEGRDITFFHNYVGVDAPDVEYATCKNCGVSFDSKYKACPECKSKHVLSMRMAYEEWMYEALYPPTIRSGSGLNTASRAIDVGLAMGFDRITILGSDCCLRHTYVTDAVQGSPEYMDWLHKDVVMHVDGSDALRSGATALVMQAEIDGRVWLTKPDMAITAVWLAEMAKHYPERLNFVGDTLVNAIKDKPDEFFDRLPALTNSKGERIRFSPNPAV